MTHASASEGELHLNNKAALFLRSQDHCRLATIGSHGFPHCVPVGYWFSGSLLYIPTSSKSVKTGNLRQNEKCCVIVDTYKRGKGKGVMLQGSGKLAIDKEFLKTKKLVEHATLWKLNRWRVGPAGKDRVDTVIVFKPTRVVCFGLDEKSK